jgi:integrase
MAGVIGVWRSRTPVASKKAFAVEARHARHALDFRSKRQSAKRWRPEELRQERAGRVTLSVFFESWWMDHAMVELKRSTLAVYRCLWEAHAAPRLGALPMGDIDARRVVRFRADLLSMGVGPTSVVKTMSMLQRVFRDAVEYGEVPFNPFKAVQKPSPGPTREARPLTPLQVERLAAGPGSPDGLHRAAPPRGTRAALVRGARTNAARRGGQHRRRTRPAEEPQAVKEAQSDGGSRCAGPRGSGRLETDGCVPVGPRACVSARDAWGLWLSQQYRTWRRRTYVPSAENVGLPTPRPYDLRHTWASLLIAEKRLSIADVAEQLGDNASTVLDVYTHTLRDWRHRRSINIEREIRRARTRVG